MRGRGEKKFCTRVQEPTRKGEFAGARERFPDPIIFKREGRRTVTGDANSNIGGDGGMIPKMGKVTAEIHDVRGLRKNAAFLVPKKGTQPTSAQRQGESGARRCYGRLKSRCMTLIEHKKEQDRRTSGRGGSPPTRKTSGPGRRGTKKNRSRGTGRRHRMASHGGAARTVKREGLHQHQVLRRCGCVTEET